MKKEKKICIFYDNYINKKHICILVGVIPTSEVLWNYAAPSIFVY